MELRELEIFCAVVEEGGIIAAARRLHRVQSNITARLQQLEQSLGAELFRREGKRLAITAAGTRLYKRARELLALAAQVRSEATAKPEEERLRLGSMESVAASRLPPLLADFYRRHPEIHIDLTTGTSREMVLAVASGALDAAFVGDVVDTSKFISIPAWREDLVLVADAGQADARSAREVRGRALLVFRTGCAYRVRIEEWLRAVRAVPERIVEVSSYHSMLACVASGAGIAVVPRSVLKVYPCDGAISIHRLPGRFSALQIRLVGRRDETGRARELLAQYFEPGKATGSKPSPINASSHSGS